MKREKRSKKEIELLALKITIGPKVYIKVGEYKQICNFFGIDYKIDKNDLLEQVVLIFKEKGANIKSCEWVNAIEMIIKSKEVNDKVKIDLC